MRILLNVLYKDNFSFFDPEYPLSLSLSKPGANVDHLTSAMKRGITHGTIIDVDGASEITVDAETLRIHNMLLAKMGIQRAEKKVEAKAPEVKAPEVKVEATKPEEKADDKVDKKKANASKKKEGEE
jgi:hypothetical protein